MVMALQMVMQIPINDGEIQVSEAEAVLGMGIYGGNISSLEGIQSFINLEELQCQSNQLTSLDISQNLNLEDLYCWDNQLTSIDITQNPNLISLVISNNQLN